MIPEHADTLESTETLRARLADAEEMLRAIRQGEIDALVVEGAAGHQVYTLHGADEPYRNLVEQMQEGAVRLTRRGDILYANARFAALVGEPLESVVGSRIARFVDAADRDDLDALLRAGSGRRRSRLIARDSDAFEVNLSLTAVASESDRLNLIVTDLREILEANSSRDRAVRESRTKDEFLAMLAHELRTPLGAISNAARVLDLIPAGRVESTRGARAAIARQVGHISRLIDDLLDVERVVSGKIQLNRQPLDLGEAVRRSVATFRGDARLDRQIDVTTEPVWVDGDAVRLEQVLANIVTNAVKYTPPGGRIRIDLRADGSDAVLSVEDTGFGISPVVLPFIFDMYVQADRTLDRARGGLGIGLTLVRRLVELHGGTIVASSGGEGQGSRFVVRLARVPAAEMPASVAVRAERRPTPKRVLLIEDSRDAREMLRLMLQLAGHEVYDAADGPSGLELLKTTSPDVGIIDIGLPRMDGYQVARRIRGEPNGRGMLLLALTGFGCSSDATEPEDDGFDYHLVKPVDLDHLTWLISEGAESGIEGVAR